MALLEMRDVGKRYDGPSETVEAIRSVSLTVEAGEVLVLLGPSGSGKSTLLLLAAGALAPDRGSVLYRGRDLSSFEADGPAVLRGDVGVAYQDPHLLPGHDILSNVAIRLLSGPVSLGEARRLALPHLVRVGLGDRLAYRPSQLSGGERRRVALARAFVCEPSLLLLDEPTASLDSATRDDVLALVESAAKAGVGVMMVTHDPAAGRIASKIHEMRDGRLVTRGQAAA